MSFSNRKAAFVTSLVLVLAAAPAAFASGGGGGGGGGANSGGVNKGGVKDTTATPPVPCATIVSLSAPVGYYSVYAALWNTYTIRSCANGGNQTYTVRVRNINDATGVADWDVTSSYALTGGQNSGTVLDNDFAPFDTTYTVEVDVSDSAGNLLGSQSMT